jgi:hypothetical protein
MTVTAVDFMKRMDEDFGSAVKTFKARGQGGQAASSLNDAKHHLDQAQHHSDQSQQHSAAAVSAKGSGNNALAQAHSDAADHHSSLSGIHANLASKILKPQVKNLGEGLGLGGKGLDPAGLYKPFDPRQKVDYAVKPPQDQRFTVQDLRRVVEQVCAEHHSTLQVLRFEKGGFIGQVTSGDGTFRGTSPSASQLEQSFTQKIRAEYPPGSVQLLDVTDKPSNSPGGYSSRVSVWKFSLKSRWRGEDPAP